MELRNSKETKLVLSGRNPYSIDEILKDNSSQMMTELRRERNPSGDESDDSDHDAKGKKVGDSEDNSCSSN